MHHISNSTYAHHAHHPPLPSYAHHTPSPSPPLICTPRPITLPSPHMHTTPHHPPLPSYAHHTPSPSPPLICTPRPITLPSPHMHTTPHHPPLPSNAHHTPSPTPPLKCTPYSTYMYTYVRTHVCIFMCRCRISSPQLKIRAQTKPVKHSKVRLYHSTPVACFVVSEWRVFCEWTVVVLYC